METNKQSVENCPICYRIFTALEIEHHVKRCIFLNSITEDNSSSKRKRAASPSLPGFSKQRTCIQETEPAKKHKNRSTSTHHQNKVWNPPCDYLNNVEKEISFRIPLTEKLQPKSLQDFFGQLQVLGTNSFLRSLLEDNKIPNMILWGPPGCGKTSLGNIISEICKENVQLYRYISICAANCGIKEVLDIITTAKRDLEFQRRTVVFMDELHRFNRKQQKAFLVHELRGDIILVGATTENPSFTIDNALLNHCKVIVMQKLESSHLILIIKKALAVLNIGIINDNNTLPNTLHNLYQAKSRYIHKSVVEWLANTSDGDARITLNNLQLILQHDNKRKILTIADIKDEIKKSHLLYDRNDEEHHNIISAMHESIKGYNDNAALYWTARMIVGGEDPLFIARRLVRAASEDIGNADPRALQLAVNTMHGCQFIGTPEADVLLAQCAVFLARAPTTKQLKSALTLAKQVICKYPGEQPEVPLHLRNIPLKLLKELGYYDLDKKNESSFMPKGLENVNFL